MISSKPVASLIAELNDGDETEHLEAKSIESGTLGASVYETVCALSNEPGLEGGTILLGVEREQMNLFPQYVVVGVGDDPDKVSSDLASGCATKFNIPVRVDISREKIGSKIVVRVDVPELNPSQKPLYFKGQGLPRGAFRRIGPTDQRCTDDDLVAFFQSKAQDSYDSSIIDSASLEDMDQEALSAYRRARAEANPVAEELNWPDDEMLHALGAVAKRSDGYQVTETGLLVFGKSSALRRISPAHRVDYIRVQGKEWVSNTEHRFDSLDLRGPLVSLIPRIMATILDDLPKTFRVEDRSGMRTDMPVLPLRVIREAVVNAVMHRNYQTAQPIQILRYSNRLEIRNPGYSLKSQERFSEPGSALRNPHIAEILHETRFAETKGSGLKVMREVMAQHGLSAPTFSSNRDGDEFSAIFLFHHFLSEKDWEWLAHFKSYSLTEDQMRALIFVREVGAIDNSSYRSVTQADTLSASKSLRHLRELNILEDKGSGSRTYYVPGGVLHSIPASDDVNMDANIITSELKRRLLGPSDLPAPLRLKLSRFGKRVLPEDMKAFIIDLCHWKPLSAEEIASVLGKTANYVSSKYLYSMVRDGVLVHLYPEMVKHPGQKYIAKEAKDAKNDAE
ncbi:MAG TPA: ATP-binding protein [Acidocella sp.]|jgi:ATP-dependent DNA helicase RecG|uniref:ATP-binding protein n=1 Tax=Acidocella sp. TaxID=50710 RepID=UPI002B94FAC1|nr:ATP-binding protein [Acidocella sp.]HVE20394.1 ATP-binding protein [Acidocella sp.]